jgi:hypothetical protein
VNDAYWLLMPYKMRDDGVVLTCAGPEARENRTWDKVLLTFEGVGLTPQDKYWVFVNRKTNSDALHLQGHPPRPSPSATPLEQEIETGDADRVLPFHEAPASELLEHAVLECAAHRAAGNDGVQRDPGRGVGRLDESRAPLRLAVGLARAT